MNAEKKDCLSLLKGRYPDSPRYFSDSNDEIFAIQLSVQPFYAVSLNIQRVKSKNDDYENRRGK
ncbi:hypothetical protein [Chryseobacterium salviniae]|uniref:Uncharacterized protein n=1 Tax=Chryseobacterium salviniae TaxID=3101750 RepID=A0ABU6HNC3_9FLAO|nr:hypothetical protein [Chryseobacterium sp. T9W2-O]MEC3874575.1 hypothetical protein [Chryseobacterium sp. T9W2-O]